MLVEHVALKPNFGFDSCADAQRISTERTLINQDLELDAFEVEMNPEKLASGKRVLQWFESDHAA